MAADEPAQVSQELVFRFDTVDEDYESQECVVGKDCEVFIAGNIIKVIPDADGGGLTMAIGTTLLSRATGEEVPTFDVHLEVGKFGYVALPFNCFDNVQDRETYEKQNDLESTVYRMAVDVAIPTITDTCTRQSYRLKRVREDTRLYHFEPCPQKQKCNSSADSSADSSAK